MQNSKLKVQNFKSKFKTFYFLIALLTFEFLFLNLDKASAAALSLTISPPTIEQTVSPGQNLQGIINLTNNSKQDLFFTSRAQDFIVEDDKGTPLILPPNTLSNKYSASAWIKFESQTFSVLPGEKKPVQYSIEIPKAARPGGHYASLLFTTTNNPNNPNLPNTSTSVQTEIGSLIVITIRGPINQDAIVSKFTANRFQEYGPVKIETQITNRGDIHINPKGTIIVTDMLNRTVDSETLPIKRIFPDAKKNYENVFGKKWMLGRFKAQLKADYGNKEQILAQTLYFWIIPWQATLVLILIIIAIILAFIYWRRSFNSSNSKFKVQNSKL